MTLWLCTRCAGDPAIPGPDLCLLFRTDPPGEGCPRGDGLFAAWQAVNSAHLEPPALIDIASQLAVIAAALLTDAIEASAELETMAKISKEQKQFLKTLRMPKQFADQRGLVSLQGVTVVRR